MKSSEFDRRFVTGVFSQRFREFLDDSRPTARAVLDKGGFDG